MQNLRNFAILLLSCKADWLWRFKFRRCRYRLDIVAHTIWLIRNSSNNRITSSSSTTFVALHVFRRATVNWIAACIVHRLQCGFFSIQSNVERRTARTQGGYILLDVLGSLFRIEKKV